jgi:hypothetical protein
MNDSSTPVAGLWFGIVLIAMAIGGRYLVFRVIKFLLDLRP